MRLPEDHLAHPQPDDLAALHPVFMLSDYEFLPESSEAMIRLTMINLMVHRLKPG